MEITMKLLIFTLTLNEFRTDLTAVHVERDIEAFGGLNIMCGYSLKRLVEAPM